MRKIILLAIGLIFIFGQYAQANTGIGFILGEPSGLSLRIDHFPVIGIAWSLNNYLHLHCDYWINNQRLRPKTYWFWGFGAKTTMDKTKSNQFTLGARVPLGLRYFPSRKIELFIEVAPGMKVFPKTELDFDAGIGIRFIL